MNVPLKGVWCLKTQLAAGDLFCHQVMKVSIKLNDVLDSVLFSPTQFETYY